MTGTGVRNTEIRVCVAGVAIRAVSSEANGPRLDVPEASRLFASTSDDPPDLDLGVRWGDLSNVSIGTPAFDSGGTWRLYREGTSEVLRLWASNRPSNPYLECRLEAGRARGSLILHRDFFSGDHPVSALQYPLDEVLMVHLLGRGRGVELHACGVVTVDGRGYLFCGQSGDGKTTTARLWEQVSGTVVLSDDRIVVREVDGRFVMYGTPWHGEAELAANRSAPVEAVFVLEHGAANRLASLSEPEATAELAARSFVPLHDRDALEWSLEFLSSFARAVPCYRFSFLPDQSALDLPCAGEDLRFGPSSSRGPQLNGAASVADIRRS